MPYVNVENKKNYTIITLNHAKSLNAITTPMLEEIADNLDKLSKSDKISCVILTGSNTFFSAGVDVEERKKQDFLSLMTEDKRFELWKKIANFDKPLIAAVSGYAVGPGFELVSLCDIVIAGDTTKFAVPEVTLASLPESGLVRRLITVCGKAKAMEIMLTGRNIDALEAEKMGVISRIVPNDYVLKDAMEVAARISEQSAVIIKMFKKAAKNAVDMGASESMEAERLLFKAALGTEDAKEGINAFIEKRKAKFQNK